MTVDERIEKAREWASRAPSYRLEDYTPADCYARANYHLLMALLERESAE